MLRTNSLFPTIAASIISLTLPSTGFAQAPGAVSAGDRVRVTAPSLSLDEAAGVVTRIDADALYVALDGEGTVRPVDYSSLTAIDVSAGQQRQAVKGLAVGFTIGAVSGALLGFAQGDDEHIIGCCTAGQYAVAFGALAGTAGAVVGLVAGLSMERDVWRSIELGDDRLDIAPTFGTRGVGVSLSFGLGGG